MDVSQLATVGLVVVIGYIVFFRRKRVNLRTVFWLAFATFAIIGLLSVYSRVIQYKHDYPQNCEIVKKDRDTTKLPKVSGCSPLDGR